MMHILYDVYVKCKHNVSRFRVQARSAPMLFKAIHTYLTGLSGVGHGVLISIV